MTQQISKLSLVALCTVAFLVLGCGGVGGSRDSANSLGNVVYGVPNDQGGSTLFCFDGSSGESRVLTTTTLHFSAATSPNGRLVALLPDGGPLSILSTIDGSRLIELSEFWFKRRAVRKGVTPHIPYDMKFSPDGRFLVVTGDGRSPRRGLFKVDLSSGTVQQLSVLALRSATVSPDGTQIAALLDDGSGGVMVFDTSNGSSQQVLTVRDAQSTQYSSDGQFLMTIGWSSDLSNRSAYIIDVQSRQYWEIAGPTPSSQQMMMSAFFVSGTHDIITIVDGTISRTSADEPFAEWEPTSQNEGLVAGASISQLPSGHLVICIPDSIRYWPETYTLEFWSPKYGRQGLVAVSSHRWSN